MLDFAEMPLWATVLYRLTTFAVLAAMAHHAFGQYKLRSGKMQAPRRCMFFTFFILFVFGAVANTIAILIAVQLDMRQGPYNYGAFSLLVSLIYLIFLDRVSHQRVRF